MADISGVLLCVRLCARPFSCAILSNQCDTRLAIFILILQMRVLRFEKAKSLAQRYRPVKSELAPKVSLGPRLVLLATWHLACLPVRSLTE